MAAVSPQRDDRVEPPGEPLDALPLARVAVVYNERSGYWIAQPEGAAETRLAALSATHGVELAAHPLDRGEIAESVDRALATRPDAIFVSGGDGTINAVVRALGDRRLPLGIIPSGTMNLLARELGMPLDFEAAVAALLDAEPYAIDLARVNGEPFLCHSMIGLMPHIARVREQARGQGHGRWRLSPRVLRKSLWLWRTYPQLGVELVAGGTTLQLVTRAITVSNNPLREGTAPIPLRDRIDRGTLGIYVLRDRSRWGLFRLAAKILAGTWHEDRDVVAYEAPSLVIDLGARRPITASNDGEAIQLETPLRYTIEPGALTVLRPRQRAARPH
jgi:diacylglycerol kinase family enzyme